MTERKIYFLTFGGSNKLFHDAVQRISNQANELHLFYKIYAFTENRLKNDITFWNKHSEFILNNKRGFGYYVWKPYVILEILKDLNDNDILLWCDCGCDININGKEKLLELFEKVNDKLILGTNGTSTDINYTKMDIVKFFNLDYDDKEILAIPQMQTGCLIIKKCDIIMNLFTEWNDICSNNYHLIDDSPSLIKNFDEFKENRHEQSVFSLLVKKYNLVDYSIDPCWCLNYNDYLTLGEKWPIWYGRNRSGIPLKLLIENNLSKLTINNK